MGCPAVMLGSPVVPFSFFFWALGSLVTYPTKKKGALIMIRLLGYLKDGMCSFESSFTDPWAPSVEPNFQMWTDSEPDISEVEADSG